MVFGLDCGAIVNVQTTSRPQVRGDQRSRPRRIQIPGPGSNPHFPDLLIKTLDDFVAGFGEQVAIVDDKWTILSVNDAWKQMVKVGGYPELVPGTDYKDFLKTFATRGHENAKKVLSGIRAIDDGETASFGFTYDGVDEWQGRKLHLRIHRLCIQGRAVATITRQDLTDSCELGRLRQDCTAAVLKGEAEARKRFTRELHDSTAQLLTSIGLLVATLKQKTKAHSRIGIMEEIQDLLMQATTEVRSISYLAHTPDVIEVGLVQSLEALAAGFGRRAQLDVSFRVLGARTRLTPAAKTAVYRIAQEALSNVHRHARARKVQMSLVFRRTLTHLVVADDGIGVSDETLAGMGTAGVGIHGMRARLAEMGGRLSLRRLHDGTAVVASVRANPQP